MKTKKAEKKEIGLEIRSQTAKEEYDYLWFVLNDMPFYKENNYTVELPDNPVFLELAKKSPKFGKINKKELFNLFKKEIYDTVFFKQGISRLESYRPMFDKAISKFIGMNQKWGFKIFPKYSVLLTRYGTGGSYYPDEGKILTITNFDGNLKESCPGESLIHEIVHIGIEKNIVNHFSLDNWEKEAVVDLICVLKFKDILPTYQIQKQGNKKIGNYITLKSINNLPKAIEKYVTDFPR